MCNRIFIVGVPRSGTTLMSMMLNAHSRIVIAPETHYFRLIWQNRRRYGDIRVDSNLQRLWRDWTATKYFSDLAFDDVEAVREKAFAGERNYAAIFQVVMAEYARKHGKERWGEKTPGHLQYVRALWSSFSGAKVIHIIRDPRDVALSHRKVPWGSDDVFAHARLWCRYMDIADELRREGGVLRFLEVHYEDLVGEPRATLERLCAFIEEPFEEGMLGYYQHSSEYLSKEEPWKDGCLRPLTASNVGKWKRELTPWDAKKVFLKCRSRMIRKGYDVGSESCGVGRRTPEILTLAAAQGAWFARSVARNGWKFLSRPTAFIQEIQRRYTMQ